jgi:hypothetical protein
MEGNPSNPKAGRVVRRARSIAWLFPLGSLSILLGAPAVVARLSIYEFFYRLASPIVVLMLGLFGLIYLPASVRIYYILLLNAKGVFTATERKKYQERKRHWDKILLKAGLLAAILLVLLGVLARFTRVHLYP